MDKQNHRNYISLQEATKFCSYSQEYLSLRARRGKLKALKLGRNWVTTEEWLKEYSEKAEEYNNSINNNHQRIITASPPENLPVGELNFALPRRSKLRPVLAFALIFVLLATGVILAAINYQDTFKFTSNVFMEYGQWVRDQALEVWTGNIIK